MRMLVFLTFLWDHTDLSLYYAKCERVVVATVVILVFPALQHYDQCHFRSSGLLRRPPECPPWACRVCPGKLWNAEVYQAPGDPGYMVSCSVLERVRKQRYLKLQDRLLFLINRARVLFIYGFYLTKLRHFPW